MSIQIVEEIKKNIAIHQAEQKRIECVKNYERTKARVAEELKMLHLRMNW